MNQLERDPPTSMPLHRESPSQGRTAHAVRTRFGLLGTPVGETLATAAGCPEGAGGSRSIPPLRSRERLFAVPMLNAVSSGCSSLPTSTTGLNPISGPRRLRRGWRTTKAKSFHGWSRRRIVTELNPSSASPGSISRDKRIAVPLWAAGSTFVPLPEGMCCAKFKDLPKVREEAAKKRLTSARLLRASAVR